MLPEPLVWCTALLLFNLSHSRSAQSRRTLAVHPARRPFTTARAMPVVPSYCSRVARRGSGLTYRAPARRMPAAAQTAGARHSCCSTNLLLPPITAPPTHARPTPRVACTSPCSHSNPITARRSAIPCPLRNVYRAHSMARHSPQRLCMCMLDAAYRTRGYLPPLQTSVRSSGRNEERSAVVPIRCRTTAHRTSTTPSPAPR